MLQKRSLRNMKHGTRWFFSGLIATILAVLIPGVASGYMLLTLGAMLFGTFLYANGWFQGVKYEETLEISHHKLEEFLCNLKMMK